MRVKITKALTDDVYGVTIATEDFSVTENELLVAHGEPEVNIGGTFTFGSETYSVETRNLKIKTGFPYTVQFDTRDNENAMLHALDYVPKIVQRIRVAMNDLKAQQDTFSGEEIFPI